MVKPVPVVKDMSTDVLSAEWNAKSYYCDAVSASSRVLVFLMDDLRYALVANCVVRVMEVPCCTPLPGTVSWFLGLTVDQQQPVPLIDLAGFFSKSGPPSVPVQKAIVVNSGVGRLIFAVQAIEGLSELKSTDGKAVDEPSELVLQNLLDSHTGGLLRLVDLPKLCQLDRFINIGIGSSAVVQNPNGS